MRREIDRNEQHPVNLVNEFSSDGLISEGQGLQRDRDSSQQDDCISLARPDGIINQVPLSIKHENDKEDGTELKLNKTGTSYSLYGLYENKTFSRL